TSAARLPTLSTAPLHFAVTAPSGPPEIDSVAFVRTPDSVSVVGQDAAGTVPSRYVAPSAGPLSVTAGGVTSTKKCTETSAATFPTLSTAPVQVAVIAPVGPPVTTSVAWIRTPDPVSAVVHVAAGALDRL